MSTNHSTDRYDCGHTFVNLSYSIQIHDPTEHSPSPRRVDSLCPSCERGYPRPGDQNARPCQPYTDPSEGDAVSQDAKTVWLASMDLLEKKTIECEAMVLAFERSFGEIPPVLAFDRAQAELDELRNAIHRRCSRRPRRRFVVEPRDSSLLDQFMQRLHIDELRREVEIGWMERVKDVQESERPRMTGTVATGLGDVVDQDIARMKKWWKVERKLLFVHLQKLCRVRKGAMVRVLKGNIDLCDELWEKELDKFIGEAKVEAKAVSDNCMNLQVMESEATRAKVEDECP